MAAGISFFKRQLFINATGAQFSVGHPWPGGRIELMAHGTTFGGQGVSLQIQAPSDTWVDAGDLFLTGDGTVSSILCPGMIRGSLGLGTNTISAWVIGVPD